MLFSLFGILLFVKFLVFWRELVLINLLLLTGLMHVDFVWLHQLSRWVLQGCWTTHSQLELFLNVGNPLKLPLCSKKEMQATHLTVISIKNYWTLRRRFFVWLFFEWTTWFTTSSPALFPRNNGRLLDLFRQSSFRKHHGSETALFKNESSGADPGFCLGGGVLVSCSTSTPINHIVFLQNTIVLENRSSSQRGCAPPAPSP